MNDKSDMEAPWGGLPKATQALLEPDSLAVAILLNIHTQKRDWVIHKRTYKQIYEKGQEAVTYAFLTFEWLSLTRVFRVNSCNTGGSTCFRFCMLASHTPRDSKWFWEYGIDTFISSKTIIKWYADKLGFEPGKGSFSLTMAGYTGKVVFDVPEDLNTIKDVIPRYEEGTFFEPIVEKPEKPKKKSKKRACTKKAANSDARETMEEEDCLILTAPDEIGNNLPVVQDPLPDMPKDKDIKKKEAQEATEKLIEEANILNKGAKSAFRKLSANKQEDVVLIYQVWNSYKEHEPKNLFKYEGEKDGVEIKWRKHVSLSLPMIIPLCNALTTHSVEEICDAIHNYASSLFSEGSYYSYAFTLVNFFSRKDSKNKALMMWWKFSSDTWRLKDFNPKDYCSKNCYSSGVKLSRAEQRAIDKDNRKRPEWEQDVLKYKLRGHAPNLYPELGMKLVSAFMEQLETPEYALDHIASQHFRLGAINLIAFFKKRKKDKSDTEMIKTLMGAIRAGYGIGKKGGQPLKVWMLSNGSTWTDYMPAYCSTAV